MAEIRGNLINLTGTLMSLYPDAQKKADRVLFKEYGKHWGEMTSDDWVDAGIWDVFMNAYAEGSITGQKALITLGRRVYPMIRKSGQIHPEINTPLKMLEYEGEGFRKYHRGTDVRPRKYIRLQEGNVLVEAPSPGYNCKVIEGVFQGIVRMFDIKSAKVIQTKCVAQGNDTCEYHITW